MKMKKSFLSLALLGTMTLGLAGALSMPSLSHGVNAEGETVPTHYTFSDTEAEYIDFISGFTSNSTPTKDLARFRNSMFWDRFRYNGLDYFCDTILTDGDENGNVTLTSREFNQKGQPYVCFLMGGGNNDNIYMSLEAKDGEGWTEIAKVKNNYFADPNVSMQMVYRFVEVEEQYRNSTLRAQFVDNAGDQGGFRLLTFGSFVGSASLNSAAKLYNMYKTCLVDTTEDLENSSNAIRTILNGAEYTTIKTKADQLGDVIDISEGFETNEGFPAFTEDYLFNIEVIKDGEEEANRPFNAFTNSLRNDASTYWQENIPFNKTGDQFFDSEKLPGGESSRARFFSTVFTLGGSGVISFKMAGESAKFALWDAETYTELIQVHGHDGIFVDGGVRPIDTVNGRRAGTMQRIVVDASKYLGKKVFIDIEDDRTGGGWGLARFDEIVTYYPTVPSFKIDAFNHTYGDDSFNAINYDKFVTTEPAGNADMKAAYNFLTTYYAAMRDPDNGYSRCGVDGTTILSAYGALSEAAKAIVDGSDDFAYANKMAGSITTDAAYTSEVIKTTVRASLEAIPGGIDGHPASVSFADGQQQSSAIVAVVVLSSVLVLATIFLIKKRKHNN